MMHVATRRHVFRTLGLTLAATVLALGAVEMIGRLQANLLVERLHDAETSKVEEVLAAMAPYRRWVHPHLVEDHLHPSADPRISLNTSLALLGQSDESVVDELRDRLLDADPSSLMVIRKFLEPYKGRLTGRYKAVLQDPRNDKGDRVRAACALADFDPEDKLWTTWAPDVAVMLTTEDLFRALSWADLLEPVQEQLTPCLLSLFKARRGGFFPRQPGEDDKSYVAAYLLARFYKGQPERLADARRRSRRSSVARPRGSSEPGGGADGAGPPGYRGTAPRPGDPAAVRQPQAVARANAAISLFSLDHRDAVWSMLDHGDFPGARSELIFRLGRIGATPWSSGKSIRIRAVPG